MLRSLVRLSREAFAVTWRYADVGDLPTALYVPMPGGDVYGQARAEVRAFLELQRLAGSDRRGFTTDLEATYRLLGRAPLEYYGWMVRDDGTSFSALVVCHPQQVVLGIVDEGTVERVRHQPHRQGPALRRRAHPGRPPPRRAGSGQLHRPRTRPHRVLHQQQQQRRVHHRPARHVRGDRAPTRADPHAPDRHYLQVNAGSQGGINLR
ncbi:MAG: ESX secretion-associated protein EspG [Sciscionella sp.]